MFRKVVHFFGGRKFLLTVLPTAAAIALQQYWMIPWIIGIGTGSIALEDGLAKIGAGLAERAAKGKD